MAGRTANRQKLKSLSRIPPSWTEISYTLATTEQRSPREAAILCGSILENALGAVVMEKFVELEQGQEADLVEGGPLAGFSNKLKLATALGLIDRDLATNLTKIGSIRNQFAHALHQLDFSKSEIAKTCHALNVHKTFDIKHKRQILESRNSTHILVFDPIKIKLSNNKIVEFELKNDMLVVTDHEHRPIFFVDINPAVGTRPEQLFFMNVRMCWYILMEKLFELKSGKYRPSQTEFESMKHGRYLGEFPLG